MYQLMIFVTCMATKPEVKNQRLTNEQESERQSFSFAIMREESVEHASV